MDTLNYEEICTDLKSLLKKVGMHIRNAKVDNICITQKTEDLGWHSDLTSYDTFANQMILEHLKKTYPKAAIVSEEDDPIDGADMTFYVDPIDGTRNFIKGIPRFFSGIAVAIEGEIVIAVTYNPTRDEVFWAIEGRGSFKNERPIKVSDQGLLKKFDLQLRTYPDKDLHGKLYLAFLPEVYQIKNEMCSHYEITGVADGTFEAFVSRGSSPWDYCQYLIVSEAGGKVTNWNGEPFIIGKDDNVVISNGKQHERLLEIIQKGLTFEIMLK